MFNLKWAKVVKTIYYVFIQLILVMCKTYELILTIFKGVLSPKKNNENNQIITMYKRLSTMIIMKIEFKIV